MPRPLVALALLSLACAARSPEQRPVAQSTLQALSVEPGVTLAANLERPTRKQIVRAVLPHNVRVFVYDGEKPRRTASGVVIGVDRSGPSPITYVLTNAHVIDPAGLGDQVRYSVLVDKRAESTEFPARKLVLGSVPDMDLGLIAVDGLALPAASLATTDELELGDDVIVAAAPYGRPISLSGGMISHLDWDAQTDEPKLLKTDAPIGYGASGGGIYSLETGKLLAVVEGYRTAKISFAVQQDQYSFDVPMPGETFAAPTAKIRRFLRANGFGWLADGASAAVTAAR